MTFLKNIVVTRYLQHEFDKKSSISNFLSSIDTNPVFRRGVRLWIQDLLQNYPADARVFLSQLIELKITHPIVDEILIGILGSNHCYEILYINRSSFLNSESFLKLYRLCEVAYSRDIQSRYPHIKIQNFGYGWTALILFYDQNENHLLDLKILPDLLTNWVLQFDVDVPILMRAR